ncbi:MAG: APC family permease [Verrucomicrobiota bacterium]
MSKDTKSDEEVSGFSALSIGVGGMVGGGIFAVTGLTIELTRGAAPLAFIVAGIVALLTAYSYWRLSLYFPSKGGTVAFLNRAFGTGAITGALNILLCLSYVILLAVYAYAFGAYGARFFVGGDYEFWKHTLITGVVVGLAVVNYFGAEYAIRSENFMNVVKMLILAIFVVVGLSTPMEWSRMGGEHWVGPVELIAGAMVIFLNYEGFELIANAGKGIRNPHRTLPIAYMGGVLMVIVFYVLISGVVVGHLDFAEVAAHSDYSLSTTADQFMGRAGSVMIIVAALLATSSAINATFYGSGRLTYVIAKSGELPEELERSIRGQPLEGMIIFAVLTLVMANFIPLAAIATMGSAGFLLLFLAVNLANVKLAKETKSRAWISGLAALACLVAVVALCGKTVMNVETRSQIWVLVGMIAVSVFGELAYRKLSGRKIRVSVPEQD